MVHRMATSGTVPELPAAAGPAPNRLARPVLDRMVCEIHHCFHELTAFAAGRILGVRWARLRRMIRPVDCLWAATGGWDRGL